MKTAPFSLFSVPFCCFFFFFQMFPVKQ